MTKITIDRAMIYTTLNKIRVHAPCADGWQKLLRHLGKTQADDEPLALEVVLESTGLNDALWCLRAVDGYDREKRLFAVACARRVQHLMTEQRLFDALDVAERYAHDQASDEELAAAEAAAWSARAAAEAAGAARAAAEAAGAAWAAAGAADAAEAAEIDWQTAEFRRVFCNQEVSNEQNHNRPCRGGAGAGGDAELSRRHIRRYV